MVPQTPIRSVTQEMSGLGCPKDSMYFTARMGIRRLNIEIKYHIGTDNVNKPGHIIVISSSLDVTVRKIVRIRIDNAPCSGSRLALRLSP